MDADRKIGITSAAIYSALSLAASALFLAAATMSGKYTEVARIGGAVWVLLLSFIVTMPLVTSAVKKRIHASERKAMTITLNVQGMTCSHCVGSVTKALQAVPGVERVDVSLEGRRATVDGTADPSALVQAVEAKGYEAKLAA